MNELLVPGCNQSNVNLKSFGNSGKIGLLPLKRRNMVSHFGCSIDETLTQNGIIAIRLAKIWQKERDHKSQHL